MVCQRFPHPMPWLLLAGVRLAWGLVAAGHTPTTRPAPPRTSPLPRQLSLGLTNILKHTHCYDDPGDVSLGHFEEGCEGSVVAFGVAGGTLDEGVCLAEAPIKMGLLGIQMANIRFHQPWA